MPSNLGRKKSPEKQKNKREQKLGMGCLLIKSSYLLILFKKFCLKEFLTDGTFDRSQNSEAPPVPAHRSTNGQTSLSSDPYTDLEPPLNGKATSLQSRNHVACMQLVSLIT